MKSKLSTLWTKRQERFNGLVERCAPGTHRQLAKHIACLGLPQDSLVLDVAAGSGAFIERMRATGLKNFMAIELNHKDFQIKGVPVHSFDLNADFAQNISMQFDLITAVEIIEHLDNPRHFLRELRKLLKPGGHLVITSPNVEHWMARLKFLIKGEPKHFGLVDIQTQRHISPILSYQMNHMFREIGFAQSLLTSAGTFWGPLKAVIHKPLGWLLKSFSGGCKEDGEILVFIAQAVERETTLAGGDSHYFAAKDFVLADHRL